MILALADDFSGAAEVAGVAHRHGLKALVVTASPIPSSVDFVAADMATRSLTAVEANEIALAWGEIAAEMTPSLLYKKTDSVLRGHLAEELSAMLYSTDRPLGLLIPANPARNRTIANGEYRIDQVPLAETEFARDPGFPIHSSRVTDLVIGAQSLSIGAPLPYSGMVIGDTSSVEDLDQWAEKTNEATLTAGASPFLAALLRKRGMEVVEQTKPNDLHDRNILLACGSQSDNARQITESLSASGAPAFETTNHSVSEIAQRIVDAVAQHPVTILRHPLEANDSPEELTARMAAITSSVTSLCSISPPHLCLEGGETAAAVLKQLDEESFTVIHEWEPGVVTLGCGSQLLATVKPGSYPWPRKLLGCESG